MAHIYHCVQQLIGHTPLLEVSHIQGHAKILAKLECFNPAGSVKDRAALSMLEDARKRGALTADSVIIEPTSGNTGIGLCALAASMGLRCIIVMPDTMSVERQMLMKAYGAEVILSPGAEGMTGAIAKAQALAATIPGAFIPDQFCNPANAKAHFVSTGPEIWNDTDGNVDIFVAGIGTGGTITGTGKYLKQQNPNIRVIGVEPATSAILSGGKAVKHGLQGIGAGFVPEVLDTGILDEVLPVDDDAAFCAMREMARNTGILVGISSGAALHAASVLANRAENAGKTIVALLPDSGERYLSTGLF